MVWIMRLRSQPEALPSLVIMWGSIPFNVAQNDVHSGVSPHRPCRYLQDHPQQRSGVAHDRPLMRKVVDEPWTAIGRLMFTQRWLRLWPGLVGRRRRALIPLHLPIQKEEKISPSRSSAPKVPVIAPSSVWTRLRSSASSSPA